MVKKVVTWNTAIGDFLGSRESSGTRTIKVWVLKNSDSAWVFVAVSENILNLSSHCFVLAHVFLFLATFFCEKFSY